MDYYQIFNESKINTNKIAIWERYCLALSSKGDFYSWGLNFFCQIRFREDKKDIVGNLKKYY